MKTISALILGLPFLAQAHEGHGMQGSHWHATDLLGFAIVLAAVAATVWWRGRK